MNTKHFTAIESRSKKLVCSFLKKYTPLLKGLTVSIMSVDNFRESLLKQKDLKQIYFTKDEIGYCKNRVSSLAGRFAAKTAINETLQKKIPWKDINILSSQKGEPVPAFSVNTNYHISISISHEEDLVAALSSISLPGITVAVGIDAASIKRTSALLLEKKIMQKILTQEEIKEVQNIPAKIAEKWAGKEAVSKAIGIGIWHGASLPEIEILTYQKKPVIRLHGKILEQAKIKGLNRWNIDFVKDPKFVLALVLATG